MNIVVDGRLILGQITGIGQYMTLLIRSLLKIDTRNNYTLFLNQELNRKFGAGHENIAKRILNIPELSLIQHIKIPIKLRAENADIYHYPHFDLPCLHNVNSVITIHDLKYIIAPEFFPELSELKKLYMTAALKISFRKARRIICVSDSTKKDILNFFNVPEYKLRVIPLAAERPEKVTHNKPPAQASKFHKKPFFLVVGERRPHKNIVRVIEGLYMFNKKWSYDYKLIIVGKSYSGYDEPENKIRALGLERDVKILGYVEQDELDWYYNNATALLFVSLYEGFGLPILEAMSLGIPVITSNLSSMPEVAGTAALTINPHDVMEISQAMVRIHSDSALRKELVQKGYENLGRFSWSRTAERTLEIYEEVHSER